MAMKAKPIRLTKMERKNNGYVIYGHPVFWHVSPEDIQSVEESPDAQIGSACNVILFGGEAVAVKECWTEIDKLLGVSTMVDRPKCAKCGGSGQFEFVRDSWGDCPACDGRGS